jgi:HEPN domain-containing protein
MLGREAALRVLVDEWLEAAQQDYDVAQTLLRGNPQFMRAIAFHAQQAAEMFIKGFLTRHQVEFPKTHDIADLRKLLAVVDAGLAERIGAAEELTTFAVKTRYRDSGVTVSLPGARSAVELAGQVRAAILEALQPYLNES